MKTLLTLLVCLAGARAAVAAPQQSPSDLDPKQVQWQRTLDDALATSSTEHRPLFIAINFDGESASDRIVTEVYRDPKFVERSRSFACLVASVSRHNPRDFDELGRRILCPRLGNVTCGEHIALEPILYERYLGGDRISPRHALVTSDGKKAFDLALQWDWIDLEHAVEQAAAGAPPPSPLPMLPHGPKELAADDRKGQPRNPQQKRLGQWRSLAAARTAFGREAFERTVDGLPSEARCAEALDAIAEGGDVGAIGVLRILLARTPAPSAELIDRIGATAAAIPAGPALVEVVRERLRVGRLPGATGLDTERPLLPLLTRFDGERASTRSRLLAQWAIGSEADRRAAGAAIGPYLPLDEPSRCSAAVEAEGGGTQLDELLVFSRAVAAIQARPAPAEPRKTLAELEAEMTASDNALAADKENAALQERFGRASEALGRHYAEAGGGNAKLYLEDAENWLGRAAAGKPVDRKLAFERARTAYFLGKFEDEERIAREALGGFPDRDAIGELARAVVDESTLLDGDVRRAATLLEDDERIEALRWIGDAAARLVPARAGGSAAVEIAGFVRASRALALVAVSPGSDETDWISLASFLEACGLEREALAAWQAGVERIPDSNALRDNLNRALFAAGRMDLAPEKADWIAAGRPQSGACAWYAAYAWMLAAEDLRRAMRYDAAIAAYGTAHARFDHSLALEPAYEPRARHFMAMSALGRGFAHVNAGRMGEAVNALVEGIATSTSVLDARDGLDRDVPDLLDALLEWKDGKKSAVDPVDLAQRLLRAAPDEPRPVMSLADSLLREARRADHRALSRSQAPRTPDDDSGTHAIAGDAVGDEYMQDSIAIARLACASAHGENTAWQYAQSLTYYAERLLARGDAAAAIPHLRDAAELMGLEAPAADADVAAWTGLATALRAKLGPAEPVFRPGR